MSDQEEISEEDEVTSVAERLRERSAVLACLWRLTEFSRIVSASICLLGPWFVLVFWLFDFLQQSFDPRRHADALKEWYFYVLLCLAFVGTSLPVWRSCEWGRRRLLACLDQEL